MKTIHLFIYSVIALILCGCGAAQSVSEGTASVAKAIFVWDVRTLHLDFTARAELNVDDEKRSSPVVIRIYQLNDASSFKTATYDELVNQDSDVLGKTRITQKEIVLRADNSISIDEPFDKNAEYVGIVALFKEPDLKADNWRLVLKRRDLNILSPRKIIVNKYTLELVEED
ncbi:type VI secretion system lipoprotein TssJ [Orbaceae bacterium ac157xtp]